MAINFTLGAEIRHDQGKGASRRLRRAGKVPGILYGAGEPALNLAFDHNELGKGLAHEAFYSHVLKVTVDGKEYQAIIKDLQRHPARPAVTHVDLLRVKDDQEIRVRVPLHFLGEKDAIGVKQQGGVVSRNLIEVEVACLPRYLPEYIDVDVTSLELNHALHLSDLKLPQGVRIARLALGEEYDLPVVAIHYARITVEEEPVAAAATAVPGEAGAAPAAEGAPAPGAATPAAAAGKTGAAPAGKTPAAAGGKAPAAEAKAGGAKAAPAADKGKSPAAGKGKEKK